MEFGFMKTVKCVGCGNEIRVYSPGKFVKCPYCEEITEMDFTVHKWKKGQYKYETKCPFCMVDGSFVLNRNFTAWKCMNCGAKLTHDEFYREVLWYCDSCDTFMNKQPGFNPNGKTHKCIQCGFINDITEENVFRDTVKTYNNDKSDSISDKRIKKLLFNAYSALCNFDPDKTLECAEKVIEIDCNNVEAWDYITSACFMKCENSVYNGLGGQAIKYLSRAEKAADGVVEILKTTKGYLNCNERIVTLKDCCLDYVELFLPRIMSNINERKILPKKRILSQWVNQLIEKYSAYL